MFKEKHPAVYLEDILNAIGGAKEKSLSYQLLENFLKPR